MSAVDEERLDMVDTPGAKLGRYELKERLGKGGTATVYKGWDTTLERPVAVKVLHDHLSEEPDFRSRFEREAKLIAGLNHPNIVQVYDFGMAPKGDTNAFYMVMSYIEGASLRRRLEKKLELGERMTPKEIMDVMRGVCSALSYAHQRGMVHRDVTPSNILFTDAEHVVLADFGIARILGASRLTQTGTTSGTPMYMAPEQGVGEEVDQRSDIYSVGVILYEMLTGTPPYTGDSAYAILMQHVNAPIPSLLKHNPSISSSLEVIVRRALAKDPTDRYPTIDTLFAELELAMSGALSAQKDRAASVSSQTTRLPLYTADLPQTSSQGDKTQLLLRLGMIGVAAAAIVIFGVSLLSSASKPQGGGSGTLVTLAVPALPTRRFAPSMTKGPLEFQDTFEPDRGQLLWQITTDDSDVYRNIENGVYHLRHTLPATAVTSLFNPDYEYSTDFMYEADLTLSPNNQRDAASGLVFRYRDDDRYYVFAVNGQGYVSLWLRYQGAWTELRKLDGVNWTPAEGAKPQGETNRLRLVDNGKRILGYVNDHLVIEVESEPILLSGATGIYLATTQSANVPNPVAEVQVDNFSVFAHKPAAATTVP